MVQLSQKFEKKAQLQDAWLDKMEKAITELDTKETDIVALRAALQRQEALAADVSAHDERVQGTAALGDELVAENYNAAKVRFLSRSGPSILPCGSLIGCVRGGDCVWLQAGERAKSLRRRHVQVDQRLRDLRLRLSSDLLQASFDRDAASAAAFIATKMPLATSTVDAKDLAVRRRVALARLLGPHEA